MTNLAAAFNEEIARIARKELRAETTALKKASATHRSEIAGLKRRIKSLEQALQAARRTAARAPTKSAAPEDDSTKHRFSAKGFASHRKRLGLSAADVGRLVGASGQSVYLWESGRARPRASHLAAIAAFRQLGKRQAMARLAETGAT